MSSQGGPQDCLVSDLQPYKIGSIGPSVTKNLNLFENSPLLKNDSEAKPDIPIKFAEIWHDFMISRLYYMKFYEPAFMKSQFIQDDKDTGMESR